MLLHCACLLLWLLLIWGLAEQLLHSEPKGGLSAWSRQYRTWQWRPGWSNGVLYHCSKGTALRASEKGRVHTETVSVKLAGTPRRNSCSSYPLAHHSCYSVACGSCQTLNSEGAANVSIAPYCLLSNWCWEGSRLFTGGFSDYSLTLVREVNYV